MFEFASASKGLKHVRSSAKIKILKFDVLLAYRSFPKYCASLRNANFLLWRVTSLP